MSAWTLNGSRHARLALLATFSVITCLLCLWLYSSFGSLLKHAVFEHPRVETKHPGGKIEHPNSVNVKQIACKGPRGSLLSNPDTEDLPHSVHDLPNVTYPETTTGSYEALGLEQSWMTFEQRYGPYGHGEEAKAYNFSRIDWNFVKWGALQDECHRANSKRFGGDPTLQAGVAPRFHLNGSSEEIHNMRYKSGRQAIVLRTWSTYEYGPEDFWNIRSIIAEASLATGGEYTVFLLVDVKADDGAMVHEDDNVYGKILQQSVPEEFQDIAVLFHVSLQESWYAKVEEFKPIWQVMQPLQLFAHFYPEFDHYWQFEMDTRFTGDVGKMLRSFGNFGKEQPYKQARERASWMYMPRVHGTYEEFSVAINRTMDGGAAWGPIDVPHIDPIGPKSPVADPREDDFDWLTGHDADLLLFGQLNEVSRIERLEDWVFKDWFRGDVRPEDPRFMSVPAQARASYELLKAVHTAQHNSGMTVPSEATLPTFALWHGLKVVRLPIPRFQYPERDSEELNFVLNGGLPTDFADGVANGPSSYRSSSVAFFIRPMTFAWWSSLCDPIYEHWMGVPNDGEKPAHVKRGVEHVTVPEGLPPFMREVDGKVYAPNLILHPRKTNSYRAPER